jgi:hypothetical protein
MRQVNFSEVGRLAKARGCTVKRTAMMYCDVIGPDGRRTAACMAKDPEGKRWGVFEVFSACHIARSTDDAPPRTGRIKPPDDLDTAAHGLDEKLIVEALVADGVVAYAGGRRTIALESLLRCKGDARGLMFADVNPRVRAAVRAVVDSGLAELAMGPRGGWSHARIKWTPAADRLTAEDMAALWDIGQPK